MYVGIVQVAHTARIVLKPQTHLLQKGSRKIKEENRFQNYKSSNLENGIVVLFFSFVWNMNVILIT